jgi:CRISP-associated protein Cas1
MFANEEVNYNQNQSGRSNNNLLMMYEGRIATFYWDCLAKVFNKLYPSFNFRSRKNKSYSWNMNASDEVNTLLNYGYAILESEVRKDINAVGLDPAIGFLHALDESKEPLVYDMQELFR